jgi:DHA1 family bicyclomycin/chloramphenicol resistance-like MFS transporter
VGSVVAILAPTIELLLAARVLQSFSAAGMVLARAIVRDTVASDQAASRIGYITMGMALVPMVAPVIGGVLEEIHGWQASFAAMLVFGVAAFLLLFFDLGETNRATSVSMAAQFRAYPGLLRLVPFWSYTLSMAFASGIFFVLVGAGPLVATAILGLNPSGYGLYFGLISLGYVIGNFVSGRYSRRIGTNSMTLSGNLVAISGVSIAFLLFALGWQGALVLFGPMTLVGIGNGMTMPNAGAGVVSVRPDLAGSASGLAGALQLGMAAIMSGLAGILVTPQTGIYALLGLMFACSLAAILSSSMVVFSKRR